VTYSDLFVISILLAQIIHAISVKACFC